MSARIVAFVALLLIGLTTRHWAGPAHADSFPYSITSACSGRCAATVLAGIQLETSMEEVFGVRGEFTPPWGYEFSKGFFLGGTFSFELFDFNSLIGFEAEAGLGQRFGTLHETEVWGAVYLRWKYFPWNHIVKTTVAVSTGVNYASSVPNYEILQSGNGKGSNALHYFSPEITFALPSAPEQELVFRIHHRSGGSEWWGENHPIFGDMFGNTAGGVQYVTAGVRHRF